MTNIKQSSVIQVIGKDVPKELFGCIGFASDVTDKSLTVNIYHPVQGKKPFIQKFELIPINQVYYIGEPNKKPI